MELTAQTTKVAQPKPLTFVDLITLEPRIGLRVKLGASFARSMQATYPNCTMANERFRRNQAQSKTPER